MPEPIQLHIDRPLTNLSIQYRNEEHIWRDVMPVVPVNKRSDIYFVYDKPDTYRLADDRLGPLSDPNEIDWKTSTDNYSVSGHGLGDHVSQEEIDNSDAPLQPEVDTNDNLNRALDLAQEKRVADKVFVASTYPAGNKVQLSGTGQWGGSADDPIGDVQTAVEGTFMRANVLVFGLDAWLKYRTLPEVLDAIKSSTRQQESPGGLASAAEVAALFDVPRILIGRARITNSNRGQTATYTRIWGKHMAALHLIPGVGVKTISFAKTFVETDRQTWRGFDGRKGEKGATYLKTAWNSDEKVVASDLGYFIEDAVL